MGTDDGNQYQEHDAYEQIRYPGNDKSVRRFHNQRFVNRRFAISEYDTGSSLRCFQRGCHLANPEHGGAARQGWHSR